MTTAQDYLNRVNSFLKPIRQNENTLHVSYNTAVEAKTRLATLRQIQKELRQIKREITQSIKEIRVVYTSRKNRIGSSASLAGALHIKGARNLGAIDKRRLTTQQNNEIAPYKKVADYIDRMLLSIDRLKVTVDQYIAQHKS